MTVQKTSKLSGLVNQSINQSINQLYLNTVNGSASWFSSTLKDGAFTAVNLNGPIRTTFVVFTETNQTQPCPRIPHGVSYSLP